MKRYRVHKNRTSNQNATRGGGFPLLVVFLLIGTISPARAKEDRKVWFACKTDRDCVIAESTCGCVAAINRKYKKLASQVGEMDCLKPLCSEWVKDFHAICKNDVCEKARIDKK